MPERQSNLEPFSLEATFIRHYTYNGTGQCYQIFMKHCSVILKINPNKYSNSVNIIPFNYVYFTPRQNEPTYACSNKLIIQLIKFISKNRANSKLVSKSTCLLADERF